MLTKNHSCLLLAYAQRRWIIVEDESIFCSVLLLDESGYWNPRKVPRRRLSNCKIQGWWWLHSNFAVVPQSLLLFPLNSRDRIHCCHLQGYYQNYKPTAHSVITVATFPRHQWVPPIHQLSLPTTTANPYSTFEHITTILWKMCGWYHTKLIQSVVCIKREKSLWYNNFYPKSTQYCQR